MIRKDSYWDHLNIVSGLLMRISSLCSRQFLWWRHDAFIPTGCESNCRAGDDSPNKSRWANQGVSKQGVESPSCVRCGRKGWQKKLAVATSSRRKKCHVLAIKAFGVWTRASERCGRVQPPAEKTHLNKLARAEQKERRRRRMSGQTAGIDLGGAHPPTLPLPSPGDLWMRDCCTALRPHPHPHSSRGASRKRRRWKIHAARRLLMRMRRNRLTLPRGFLVSQFWWLREIGGVLASKILSAVTDLPARNAKQSGSLKLSVIVARNNENWC